MTDTSRPYKVSLYFDEESVTNQHREKDPKRRIKTTLNSTFQKLKEAHSLTKKKPKVEPTLAFKVDGLGGGGIMGEH